jgi:hypothetical protein
VIGIIQDAHDNGWLETLNADQYVLDTEQNEKGAILWVANKSVPEANLDGYFIYKHDNAPSEVPAKYRPDNADIYTFGGRLTGLVAGHWKYSAEGAYQFGEKQDLSIQYPSPSTATSMRLRSTARSATSSKIHSTTRSACPTNF